MESNAMSKDEPSADLENWMHIFVFFSCAASKTNMSSEADHI